MHMGAAFIRLGILQRKKHKEMKLEMESVGEYKWNYNVELEVFIQPFH